MNLSKNKNLSVYTDLNSGIYTVLFFRKMSGSYVFVDKQKMKIDENKFVYKKKDFINFNRNTTLFLDKKSNYFAFDYDTGKQIQFNTLDMPTKITLDEIDKYVNQGLIKQLALNLEKPKSDKGMWIWLLIGVAIGGMAGFIISSALSGGVVI